MNMMIVAAGCDGIADCGGREDPPRFPNAVSRPPHRPLQTTPPSLLQVWSARMIDWAWIGKLEGRRLAGYVPESGKSGAPIRHRL